MEFYKKKLKKDTTAHDKIEFEIVYSNFDFNTENRTKELLDNGFSKEERQQILESLKELTVTKATARNRKYDGTNQVAITEVLLSGMLEGDEVSVDLTDLHGTLKDKKSRRI